MTLLFYAQPYDISAEGFYFRDAEEYERQAETLTNRYGDKVEEFEIQFIDGEEIDAALSKAWGLNQANFAAFIEAAEDWDEEQKIRVIIAVGECGYGLEQVADDPDSVEIDIHHLVSLKDLAESFVDDGLYGEVPKSLQYYIDYDAIARDLSVEYSETEIAGQRLIYRAG